MNFLKDPRTNWKYILIVAILAIIVGGGILGYQYWWLPKWEARLSEVKTPEKEQGLEEPKGAAKGEAEKEQALEFSGFLFPGESEEIVFSVDGDNLYILGFLMEEDNSSFKLTDPEGSQPSFTTLASEEEFSILYKKGQIREDGCIRMGEGGLIMTDCFFGQPVKGEWVVDIASGLKQKVGIVEKYLEWSLSVSQKSSITFEFDTTEEAYSADLPIVFRGVLSKEGIPLEDASVKVSIGPSPASIKHTLNLFDDGKHNDLGAGDGVYGNEWVRPEAGHLLAQAEVKGKLPSGIPYMRQERVWFTVEPKSAHFSDEYSDTALDEDGDGLFDKLRIKVAVILEKDGEYEIHGKITELDGEEIQWGWVGDLISGKAGEKIVAELNFPKEAFMERKVDGPVVLSELWLMDKSVDLRTDSRENAYTTKNYQNLDFSGWEAVLAGSIKDRGVDTDNNGKFDYLEVEIPIKVRRPGTYTVQSLLLEVPNERKPRTRALEEETAFNFSPGVNTLTLRFSGPRIAMYATDGPYLVNNFQLVGPLDDLVLVEHEVGETGFYSWSDFEQDTMPPVPLMNASYETSQKIFNVSWSATDPSPSIDVVISYDLQYRVGPDGTWTDWLTEATISHYAFGPDEPVIVDKGQTYYFRIRARDFAGNQSTYSGGDGDTHIYVIE